MLKAPPASQSHQAFQLQEIAPQPGLPKGERIALWGLACLMLALKVVCAFRYRIDSDEPQHLHTVWAWASGMIPYRDVFDNHTPIFQFLCAPLFRLLGERADIVIPMRLAMVPLYGLSLWCVYRVVATVASRRAAIWAAMLAGLAPTYFLVSTEFRTDDLWTLSWLLVLVMLVGKPVTLRRAFLIGLLVGATFGVSMKTSLLLGTLLLAAVVVGGIRWMVDREWRLPLVPGLKFAALGLVGACVVPALLALFFYLNGAWKPLIYCVFQHNLVPGLVEANDVPLKLRPFFFPVGAPLLALAAFALVRRNPCPARRVWRAVFLLAAGFYLAVLWSYWPIHSTENYEPFFPLLAIGLAPLVAGALERISLRQSLRWAVFAAVLAFCFHRILTSARPWVNNPRMDIQLVADALKLTAPGQFVMDGKCESIYRPRPFYYVLETMTDARFARGWLVDDIAQRLIDTRTPLARTLRLPREAYRFVRANYLRVNSEYRVLGKRLKDFKAGSPVRFEVAVPSRYAIADSKGLAPGMLDGTPFTEPRWIEPGSHTFEPSRPGVETMLIWADAYEKGFGLCPDDPYHGEGRSAARWGLR